MNEISSIDKYLHIINLPHHVSNTRKPMSVMNRAAQFAPFAALNGHEELLSETARTTDHRIELSENEKIALSKKLMYVLDHLSEQSELKFSIFQPDGLKAGGTYVSLYGKIKGYDDFNHIIKLENGIIIPIENLLDISGSIFNDFDP